MPTIHHNPLTFRFVRDNYYEVLRDGKRLGSLIREPENALRHAGRWRFWGIGQAASPPFRDLEHAQQEVGDLF